MNSNIMRTVFGSVLVLACVLPAPAQKNNTQSVAAQSNSGSTYSANAQTAGVTEDRISREVRHELLMLPYYSVFDDLEYSVHDGTVTLKGYVVNPVNKSDAEAAVKHVPGVNNVVNDIEIAPPFPDDDRIRLEEYHKIYGTDGLYKYGTMAVPAIHIIVKAGRVTLKGVVDNQFDKQLIDTQANSVPGVFSVTDDLVIAANKSK